MKRASPTKAKLKSTYKITKTKAPNSKTARALVARAVFWDLALWRLGLSCQGPPLIFGV
jgi:hypothetical protein